MPDVSATPFAPRRARRIASVLEAWFLDNMRPLPWRTTRNRTGYRGLVAEAMLQQTQVSRVAERYGLFLEHFPTVRSLASADEQDVLAAWQGLGYYRRARSLQAAARKIVNEHGGRVPRDVETLRTLPGVGRYTAGAIASIVFGARVPIVDGNVHRVLSRLEGDPDPLSAPGAEARAWARAKALVEAADEPARVNEATMEFGATVCTPRGPKCGVCPLTRSCAAFKSGEPESYPRPKPRAAKTIVYFHAVIVTRGARLGFERRKRGLWSGLWQPPTVESERRLSPAVICERLATWRVDDLKRRGAFVFQTTHREVRFEIFAASSSARRGTWRHPHALHELPMSAAHRRVMALRDAPVTGSR